MRRAVKVFITGASSGIGSALADHYASQGAVLGLAARRGDALETLAEKLLDAGAPAVLCYPLDVTDAAALRTAAHDFIARHGAPASSSFAASVSSASPRRAARPSTAPWLA